MGEPVGVGGVVAALSVASDLTRGHPPGEAMRACLLATELARREGLDGLRQVEVYYATLLRFAGCAATSHEIAATFGGDDIVVRARGDLIDPAQPEEALQFLAGLGVDAGRLRVLGGPAGVARLKAEGARADCEVGADLTARLRLPDAVRRAVLDSFERFDLRRLAAGLTKKEIAGELVISLSTVHTHTVHIYAKCGVSTRAALAMFAMRHGLTGASPAPAADAKID